MKILEPHWVLSYDLPHWKSFKQDSLVLIQKPCVRQEITPQLITAKSHHSLMFNCNTSLIGQRADTKKSEKHVSEIKGLREKKRYPEVTLSSCVTLFRILLKQPTLSFFIRRSLRNLNTYKFQGVRLFKLNSHAKSRLFIQSQKSKIKYQVITFLYTLAS